MDIKARFASLFPHEREALLEALRRDVRTEQCKVKNNPQDAHFHSANSRIGIQILETLNPKKGTLSKG
ncbi:hypothetical protein [Noviherbaspirillum album]|jgi:hypothetical protein|uniref:hypothetical protein n=1 Tax=Noviherbaspirillum album TaxID=3080276 RepID=UPI002DD62472|nr:hypothetical protein [Noviherbaspirillum sp. CPCC 100848]